MAATPRIRQAARAVLVDPDDRTLLVQFRFPRSLEPDERRPPRHVWATPGGGIEPDEHPHDTLRRELHEELGFAVDTIGPEVWTRTKIVPFLNGQFDGQRDRYYLIRCDRFEPEPAIGWERLRSEYVVDLQWWTRDELARSAAVFAPTLLAAAYGQLLDAGPSARPVDLSD